MPVLEPIGKLKGIGTSEQMSGTLTALPLGVHFSYAAR